MTNGRMVVRTGDVWAAYFDPAVGHEQRGRRPAVIVSGEQLNLIPSELAFVVPATSTNLGVASHVPILMAEGKLPRESFAMPEQFRSVSHLRLRQRLGAVHPTTLDLIVYRLLLLLDAASPGQQLDT